MEKPKLPIKHYDDGDLPLNGMLHNDVVDYLQWQTSVIEELKKRVEALENHRHQRYPNSPMDSSPVYPPFDGNGFPISAGKQEPVHCVSAWTEPIKNMESKTTCTKEPEQEKKWCCEEAKFVMSECDDVRFMHENHQGGCLGMHISKFKYCPFCGKGIERPEAKEPKGVFYSGWNHKMTKKEPEKRSLAQIISDTDWHARSGTEHWNEVAEAVRQFFVEKYEAWRDTGRFDRSKPFTDIINES